MVDSVRSSVFPSTAANAAGTPAAEPTSRAQLIENFDTFLQLLVTQIQNQDPTEPISTESFTQQLVQFSELEQSIQSNSNLESIQNSIASQNAASVVSYIGSTVTAEGATTTLTDREAVYTLTAQEFIPEAEISIRDALGNVVFTTTQALQPGNNSFVFDGRGANGRQFNDGSQFTITVQGRNAADNVSPISTSIRGVVEGVDFSGETPNLRIGSTNVPLSAVQSVVRSL